MLNEKLTFIVISNVKHSMVQTIGALTTQHMRQIHNTSFVELKS
jgi:hypothetical protein